LLGGLRIDLSAVIMITVTCLIVFILARLSVRKLSVDKPSKLQNFMEWVVDFVRNTISSTMDMDKGKAFVQLGLTLIMFIFVANMLGLPFAIVTKHDHGFQFMGQEVVAVSGLLGENVLTVDEKLDKYRAKGEEHPHTELVWWKSPTADASVTMGFAFITIILVHFLGITRNTKAYFKHYFQPNVAFFPIHAIEQVANFLTLGLRLYGNIFAGEVLITVLIGAGFFAIPGLILWQGFSIFVGAIQAFIFIMLTMVYLSQKLEKSHDH